MIIDWLKNQIINYITWKEAETDKEPVTKTY